jgi:hypothetical protein
MRRFNPHFRLRSNPYQWSSNHRIRRLERSLDSTIAERKGTDATDRRDGSGAPVASQIIRGNGAGNYRDQSCPFVP